MKRRPLEGTGVFVFQFDKPKQVAAYLLLVAAMGWGFYEDWRDDREDSRDDAALRDTATQLRATALRLRTTAREACSATNVIRENQAGILEDQIEQNEDVLAADLGALEPFREQIEEGNNRRKRRLRRLRRSLEGAPRVDGRAFAVDCEAAYR